MSCTRPLTAYRGSGGAIVFDIVKSLSRIPMKLPCGRCIGCRLDKAHQWGMRCMHEAKMHRANSYVTLTYSPDFMPPGGSLCLRDVQLFMKRLRKSRPAVKMYRSDGSHYYYGVRFFLGGEYGEENRRPHYHALLFNCGFPDRLYFAKNARGDMLYTSGELSRLWSIDGQPMGHVTVGDVTYDSAVYCAKYALKSINVTDKSTPEAIARYEERYVVYDADGVVHERVPEFAVMSRRPGIGAGYYDKYGDEVRNLDSVVVDGREIKPARFYDSRSERVAPELFARLKRKRKRLAVLNKADNTPERLLVKEKIMTLAAEKKERKL